MPAAAYQPPPKRRKADHSSAAAGSMASRVHVECPAAADAAEAAAPGSGAPAEGDTGAAAAQAQAAAACTVKRQPCPLATPKVAVLMRQLLGYRARSHQALSLLLCHSSMLPALVSGEAGGAA